MFKTKKNYELSRGRKNENFLPIEKEAENISIASGENELIFAEFIRETFQKMNQKEKDVTKKLLLEEKLTVSERQTLCRMRKRLGNYSRLYSPHTSGGNLTKFRIFKQDADVLMLKDKYEIAEICSLEIEKPYKAKFTGFKHMMNGLNAVTGFKWLYPVWKFQGLKRDEPKPNAYKLPAFMGGRYIDIPAGQEAAFTRIKTGIRESYNLENEEEERGFEAEENSQGLLVYQAYRKEMKRHLKETLPQIDYLSQFEYKSSGR